VEFRPLETHYTAVFPERSIQLPFGFDAYVEAHCEAFPDEAERLRQFFEVCRRVHKENHELPPQIGLAGLDDAAKRFPTLFGYLRATVSEVLDEFLEDPQAKAACTALWPHLGSPPSRLSFVTFALAAIMEAEGSYYCVGGFQSLVDALVAALERDGGELVVDAPAERILVEDGRVTGVALGGGEVVGADVVISNADARETLEGMVGEEHLPARLLKRTARMKPSPSAVVITAATSLDLRGAGLSSEVFNSLHWDHDASWADIHDGRPGGMWAAFTTLEDPSLAPAGEHIAIISSTATLAAHQSWREAAEPFAERLLDAFEPIIPGLRDSLTFSETATPETLQRYTRNQDGAIYGWESTPNQSGGRRSPNQPPVEGLFLAGHWTQPGAASLRVLVSGLNAAEIASNSAGWGGLGFSHTDRPPI
jgi:prolycopene isomerase